MKGSVALLSAGVVFLRTSLGAACAFPSLTPAELDRSHSAPVPANALVSTSSTAPKLQTKVNSTFASAIPASGNLIGYNAGDTVNIGFGSVTLSAPDLVAPTLVPTITVPPIANEMCNGIVMLNISGNAQWTADEAPYVAIFSADTEVTLDSMKVATMFLDMRGSHDEEEGVAVYAELGKRCIEAAFVDYAGNIGPRTVATCYEGKNTPRQPGPQPPTSPASVPTASSSASTNAATPQGPSTAGGCSTASGAGDLSGWLLLVGAMAARRRPALPC